jgi:hypothetical protein
MSPVLSKSKDENQHQSHMYVNYKRWYKSKEIYQIFSRFPFEPVFKSNSNFIVCRGECRENAIL